MTFFHSTFLKNMDTNLVDEDSIRRERSPTVGVVTNRNSDEGEGQQEGNGLPKNFVVEIQRVRVYEGTFIRQPNLLSPVDVFLLLLLNFINLHISCLSCVKKMYCLIWII